MISTRDDCNETVTTIAMLLAVRLVRDTVVCNETDQQAAFVQTTDSCHWQFANQGQVFCLTAGHLQVSLIVFSLYFIPWWICCRIIEFCCCIIIIIIITTIITTIITIIIVCLSS